eukprot:GILK01005385.1.p1 GENE.GILK01005385.1~~GILK01005385.1.p1  ORF type:complete len:216 (-),score=60.59 GILK01005385.1:206-817(-)
MSELAELGSLLREASDLFCDSSKEEQTINSINQEIKDIISIHNEREKNNKQIIRELTTRVELSEREATRSRPAEEFQRDLAVITEEQNKTQKDIERLEAQKTDLQQVLEKIQDENAQASTKMSAVQESEIKDIPQIRSTISLFANISGIKWDYSSTEVAGFIVKDNSQDVNRFRVNPKEHSTYFTTNYLWDLLADSKKSAGAV